MRALRLGSYSMWATFAGIASLSRRKSISRYCCLWPPPWWRVVIRPWTLRPAFFGLGTTSDRSGWSRVMSEKSANDIPRRPGVVGLAFRMVMVGSLPRLEEFDLVALGELDDGSLRACPGAGDVAGALGLALAVAGVDADDLHAPDLLHRVADVDLRGLPGHEKRVGVVVDEPVGLLADDRAQDDVAGGGHSASPASGPAGLSPVSPLTTPSSLSFSGTALGAISETASPLTTASAVSFSGTASGGAAAAVSTATSDFVISARASRVRTTTSAASTRYVVGTWTIKTLGRFRNDFQVSMCSVGSRWPVTMRTLPLAPHFSSNSTARFVLGSSKAGRSTTTMLPSRARSLRAPLRARARVFFVRLKV